MADGVCEAGGNDERQAFLWDSGKVELGEKIGKLAVPRQRLRSAFGTDISAFDRTPYIASFRAGKLTLVLVGVHSYFGKGKGAMPKRIAETRAIAWWCDKAPGRPRGLQPGHHRAGRLQHAKGGGGRPHLRRAGKARPAGPGVRVADRHGHHARAGFVELEAQGKRVPAGSTISTDSQYDQFVIAPEHTGADILGKPGVFDFDAVLFSSL